MGIFVSFGKAGDAKVLFLRWIRSGHSESGLFAQISWKFVELVVFWPFSQASK